MPDNKTDSPPVLMKKRFIAGAVCPQCRAVDRIQVEYWQHAGAEREIRLCVACDFREASAPGERAASKPLANLPRIRRGQQSQLSEAQPVRLLDPSEPKPSN